MKKLITTESAGVLSVIVVLLGIPLSLWYWKAVYVPSQLPPGTHIIHLTAVAEGGVWTEDRVVGFRYWWHKPKRVREIFLTQGEHVALFLHSPDVQHSISLPELKIGPLAINAGHTVKVEFDAKEAGELNFMCVQVCGRDHSKLAGRFIVVPPGAPHVAPPPSASASMSHEMHEGMEHDHH